MEEAQARVVAVVQGFHFGPGQRIEFDTGVADRPSGAFGLLQGEQGVQAGAEACFEDVRTGGGGGLQPHVDEDVLRLGAGAFHGVVMLVQFGHVERGAAVFGLFNDSLHSSFSLYE